MLSKTYTKYIQSLHHKKNRDAEQRFIAEGNKVVMELLQAHKFECMDLLGEAEWLSKNEVAIRKFYTGSLQVIETYELQKISALSTSNFVLGVFKKAPIDSPVLKDKVTLMLDTIQDPGNLGTIIRIADWFGIENIICSNNTVELYNTKVVQSTMGSLGRINVHYENLEIFLAAITNIPIYAAALEGKYINDIQKLKEGIIVIGNESIGISDEIMAMAKVKITIQKKGKAESLNAAVAAGIVLSHLV